MGSDPAGPTPNLMAMSNLKARGYQFEMFERSMKDNVIVAMDTGSGKTHIALLRIVAEIDRGPPGKLIWFLAPTVALCTQQHDSINTYLPSLRTKLLLGSDNVDRWSEQRIWDAVLANIQVVVSTHAVLADALTHGFIKMGQLALLVFDEAHHCVRGHPANKIMDTFYHPRKAEQGAASVPHVLGLSASPIMRSKISELESIIEANLDAVSITPHVNRQELLRYVHRPTLHRLEYEPHDPSGAFTSSPALNCLRTICGDLKLQVDSGVGSLIPPSQHPTHNSAKRRFQTRLEDHLVRFCNKAIHIYMELGPWAADYFILESITALESVNRHETDIFSGERDGHRESLLRILKHGPLLKLLETRSFEPPHLISPKVKCLIAFLSDQNCNECSGLLFVKQRATVSVLCTLISSHPLTKEMFQCATFVGTSNYAARKYGVAELLDIKAQRETLAEFRAKRKNLVIATDALEEGIDVAKCNLVICFDPPPNVKSFIQRRGRARQEKSKFAIMVSKNDRSTKTERWRVLEENLIRAYQDEMRQKQDIADTENQAEVVPGKLEVESGACLTPNDAVAHIHHFCATLPYEPYVDLRPTFAYDTDPATSLITARVILPNSLNASLRAATGIGSWRTERAAAKDAAFQAYVALHKAGLLNENLLPLSRTWNAEETEQQQYIDSVLDIPQQFRPWAELVEAWSAPDLHQMRISLHRQDSDGQDDLLMVLTAPSPIPRLGSFDLYLDESTTFTLDFDAPQKASFDSVEIVHMLRRSTHIFSRSTHSDYAPDDRTDFIILFHPCKEGSQLASWFEVNHGRVSALERYRTKGDTSGFVRSISEQGRPHTFRSWSVSSSAQGSTVEVECIPLPKRRHFLTPSTLSKKTELQSGQAISSNIRSFQVEDCTFDRLPFKHARFNLFVPAILRHLELLIVAERLRTTILGDVPISDIRHLATAITAPSAGWVTDYQRLEFFGDTVLKFAVSYQLFCDHDNWHEGYLSEKKDSMVSNQKLANAALRKGLERYIVTEGYQSKKWSPLFMSDIESGMEVERKISAKVLADVVEALIGAAYIDGGVDAARKCIHVFVPEIYVSSPQHTSRLSHEQSRDVAVTGKAEVLIGHNFRNKVHLLEALTHPSCDRDTFTESYQRLEFLGDAVLDMLVISLLTARQPTVELSQGKMTLVKSALVNAQFLGFLCLDFGVAEETFIVKEQPGGRFVKEAAPHNTYLWTLMRHWNSDIVKSQTSAVARYKSLYGEIRQQLSEGTAYPWLPLAKLNVDKFFSDMMESLVGAIFVDSGGDFIACQRFITRIGFVPYLNRVLAGDVDITHPKTALERLAGSERVEYNVRFAENDNVGEQKLYGCTVCVGGVEVAIVDRCLSTDEAIILGALEAAKKLGTRQQTSEENAANA